MKFVPIKELPKHGSLFVVTKNNIQFVYLCFDKSEVTYGGLFGYMYSIQSDGSDQETVRFLRATAGLLPSSLYQDRAAVSYCRGNREHVSSTILN